MENIRYYRSVEKKVDENLYDEKNKQKDCNRRGRRRTLKPEEEFVLVTCQLRQGFHENHLAFLWHIYSQPTVSRILSRGSSLSVLRFGSISIFPSREEVNKTMPKDYNVKCPNTRVGGSEWVLGFSVVCP